MVEHNAHESEDCSKSGLSLNLFDSAVYAHAQVCHHANDVISPYMDLVMRTVTNFIHQRSPAIRVPGTGYPCTQRRVKDTFTFSQESFEESKSENEKRPGYPVQYSTAHLLILFFFDSKKIKIAPESHARMGSRGGSRGRRLLAVLLAASCASSAAPFGHAGPVTPQLGNAWCSDEHFLRTFLAPGARNEDGLPLRRLREFDTAEPGWQRLLGKSVGDSSETPSQSFGVCPCHNAGFTADSEQWDGQPSSGMEEVSGECYFSIPRCAQYLERGNCPGASPKLPADSSSPARILVATTTPYTVGQLSTRQAGRCSASCEFSSPSFGEAVNLEHFDGIVWPLDWSFGRSNTLPVPTDPEFTRAYRHRQLWIAFSEEEVFKTEGGRPDLWRNRSFLSMFNLTATYDYASADLPFNLWRFHSSPCTANVYFAPAPDFHTIFADNLRYETARFVC